MIPPGPRDRLLQPVGLLALCPLLAAGSTLLTAVCVGLLFLTSSLLLAVTMAALGRSVTPDARILTLLLASGIWTTILDLLLQAFSYPLSVTLGMYVPLVAVNTLLLAVGEQSLRCGSLKSAAQSGLQSGFYVAAWLVPLGLCRELLGAGALLSDARLLPGLPGPWVISSFPVPALQTVTGAFIVLALVGAWVGTWRVPAHD